MPAMTSLAEPVRARQVLHGRAIVDPADGRERFWLTNMNEEHGGELIAVDFARDTADVYSWPAGHGSWCVLPLSGDRLAISTYYDGKFLLFDLRAKAFSRVVDFPGESYIWDMAVGADGRVYGGTYNGAKLGSFDPETGDFRDHGTIAQGNGNLYLRNVLATPGGDIACTFGYAAPMFAVWRIASGRFEILAPPDEGAQWSPIATLRNHLFVSDSKRGIIAFCGAELYPVDPPLPPCPVASGWGGIARYSTDEMVWLSAGRALWRWIPETGDLAPAIDIDFRGGRILDVSREGSLLGVRGQDYFVAAPRSTDIALRRIPGETKPRPFHFLVSDDAGWRLWGGPPFGQTVSAYDLATGESFSTGAVVDAGGEVYGAAAVDGKLYTASYSGADFAIYDPAQPWDQWNNANPRRIASISDRNQCRPTGRMYRAPDGMLYSGWQAIYGRYGGALARLDPGTDKATVWEDPLGEEPIVALAVDDRYAYLGTNHSANGLPTRDGDGQFGVFDLRAERIVFSRRMPGMHGVGAIGVLRGMKGAPSLVLFPEGDRLHVFDAGALAFRDDLPATTPDGGGWCEDIPALGDGSIVFARGKWLVRVRRDDEGARVETVGPLEHAVHHLTRGPDGFLYASSGTVLYRIEGVA